MRSKRWPLALAALVTVVMTPALMPSAAQAADEESYEDGNGNFCEGALCPSWATHVTGAYNIALGYDMMPALTVGNENIATDTGALFHNTMGNGNIATGFSSLYNNTRGSQNIATGSGALYSNTKGSQNIATGGSALYNNTTGNENIATGHGALYSNTIGSQNVATGRGALSNATGERNLAFGDFAGYNLTTGSGNIDISNEGVAADEGTTRIGTEGKQTQAFVAGIYPDQVTGCTVQVTSAGQLGCNPEAAGATGATGPAGPTGPAGATGPTGAGGASFEFSTGGASLGNNRFVGLGAINGTEGIVQQSIAPSGTLTKMTCFQNGTASVAVTYTLRDNSASTTLTCTIPAGSTKGEGTGSVPFASGDLLDVKTPASGTPGKPGSFSVSTG